MLNHVHYQIIIFLYTEDKQENITDKRPRHFSSRAIAKNRNKTISRNSTVTVEDLGITRSARGCLCGWCL